MTQFQMEKCRKIIETYQTKGDLSLVKNLVEVIEQNIANKSNGVFCLAYSLIDTACKTIFTLRGINDGLDDLPKRFKKTLKELNLVSPTYGTVRVAGLDTTLNGLERAVLGLCELRNEHGVFSHGKSAEFKFMDDLQLQLAAETADIIVNYLFQAHYNYAPIEQELIYEDNQDFNEWIDQEYSEIEIMGQTFLPSQILFSSDTDHASYREALIEYQQFWNGDAHVQEAESSNKSS